MLHWVFDLDYTLYSLPKHIPFGYDKLHLDPELKRSINSLPGRKAIFTNGTRQHAYNSVVAMGLEQVFHSIEGRDSVDGLKPDPHVYYKFIQKNQIEVGDKILFFEDTLSNLQTAKEFGWITVYIKGDSSSYQRPQQLQRPQRPHHPRGVDFSFSNITEALEYFNHHMET